MIPQKNRLTRTLFGLIVKDIQKVRGVYLSLGFIETSDEEPTKTAVVVSKKVLKKAHDRNRARRRVYMYMREILKQIPQGYAFILRVEKDILKLPPQALTDELRILFEKARINPIIEKG